MGVRQIFCCLILKPSCLFVYDRLYLFWEILGTDILFLIPFLVFVSEFEFRGDWFVKCFIMPTCSIQMSLSGMLHVWSTCTKVRENRSLLLYSITLSDPSFSSF